MAKSPERIIKKKKPNPKTDTTNADLVSNGSDYANLNFEIANDSKVHSPAGAFLNTSSLSSDFIKSYPYTSGSVLVGDDFDDNDDYTDRMVEACDRSCDHKKAEQRPAVVTTLTSVGDFSRDQPESITEIIFGSPAFVARKSAPHLDEYFNKYRHLASVADADFNRSQVIFCGGNHRGLAFYELVKDLIKKGKKIRAVFMEEINSDAQAKDYNQNIIDRHFVVNKEKESLKYAFSGDELDTDVVIEHLVKESAPYLDKYLGLIGVDGRDHEAYLDSYYRDFLNLLGVNNIHIGGIDHSKYREKPSGGYDCNRHAYMNFHAAMILKSYFERLNFLRVPLAHDEVVLVSIGNAHGIDRFNQIEMSDGHHIAIPSVQTIFKAECANQSLSLPTSSISFVADPDVVEKDGYDTKATIIHLNKYSNYELYSERSDKSPSNAKYKSKYLAVAKTNHELDRNICEFAGLIVAPIRSHASVDSMVAPPPPPTTTTTTTSSVSLFGRR